MPDEPDLMAELDAAEAIVMGGATAGPGGRLIEARARMKRAMLNIEMAELNVLPPGSFASSDEARDVYRGQYRAARELVAAQDAFDAWCEARAAIRFNPEVPRNVREDERP